MLKRFLPLLLLIVATLFFIPNNSDSIADYDFIRKQHIENLKIALKHTKKLSKKKRKGLQLPPNPDKDLGINNGPYSWRPTENIFLKR